MSGPYGARLLGYLLVLASSSAHAPATAGLGALLPGRVAHPPFSINSRCFHESVCRSPVSFAVASDCFMKFSTQIGVRAAVTAESARCCAIFSAVSPRVHPNPEKPMIMVTTAPMIAPQTAGLSQGTCITHLLIYSVTR